MGENALVVRTGVSINGTMDATAQLAGQRGKPARLREYANARFTGSVSMTCQFLEISHLR